MKILVIGGTRFYGRAFTELAIRRGHEITLFHRGQSDSEHFDGAQRVLGDREHDLDKLGTEERWDAVLDTCAYTPNVITQSAQYLYGRVNQYVFVSSISVYADSTEHKRTEATQLVTHPEDAPTDELNMAHYGSLKMLCESAVEGVMPGQVTHIRPGLIVGPNDPTNRFTYWVTRLARGGEVLVPGAGDTPVQIIDARDLAEFTLTVIENRTIGTYHVTGPQQPHTLAEIINTAQEVSASDAQQVHVDEAWLLEQEVTPWSQIPLWLPSAEGQALMDLDISEALNAGLVIRPLAETVRDTLDWHRSLADTDQREWPAGLPPEREAELLASWSAHQA
ncbi:MAG: NAD-dependent epimerase/dehydratase family protein [Anaerolineae bacterium]